MKVKTSDLIGPALDWAVCGLEGQQMSRYTMCSTDWSAAGSIIEREGIGIGFDSHREKWLAATLGDTERDGPTPLIAAMRAYVASELGNEVEIPAELIQGEQA